MAFLEDPRLRQRWNQISHNAETVTENAAAGIWSFSHNYVNPCLAALAHGVEACAAPCLGDREERARRRRERERVRGHGRAEYSFDFYDDWYAEYEGFGGGATGGGSGGGTAAGSGSGLFGAWSNDDWDQLLAGSGAVPGAGSSREINEQPRRKRGMSYGTRGHPHQRKRPDVDDPTVIPSTQPLGFLARLPWKIGGTLRYKPSAADLQDNPRQQQHHDERTPLLMDGQGGAGDDNDDGDQYYYHYDDDDDDGAQAALLGQRTLPRTTSRKRSGTVGSGDTSDSYRSRGDLFPSDGEGDEDAVPLDDEFTLPLDAAGRFAAGDDRSSNRTRSSKGKRPAGAGAAGRILSRTMSRTTVASQNSAVRSPPLSRASTESMAAAVAAEGGEENDYLHIRPDSGPTSDKEGGVDAPPKAAEVHLDVDSEVEETPRRDAVEIPDEEQSPTSRPADQGPETGIEQQDEDDTGEPRLSEEVSTVERSFDFVPARLPSFS